MVSILDQIKFEDKCWDIINEIDSLFEYSQNSSVRLKEYSKDCLDCDIAKYVGNWFRSEPGYCAIVDVKENAYLIKVWRSDF